eukprot:4669065-Pleurochrysis_carterae.AAC.1
MRQTDQQNGVFPTTLSVYESCGQMHGALGGAVHRPSHELYFGFNVPKAHWLYPHYLPTGAEVEVQPNSIRLPAGAHHAPTPLNAHQQWPRWKDEFTSSTARSTAMNNSVRKFYQYFKDLDTIKDQSLQFRRAYALADVPVSDPLPQTVHAPSNVTPTSIPETAPPAPAQYGEHTDNAEPPETTNDGD